MVYAEVLDRGGGGVLLRLDERGTKEEAVERQGSAAGNRDVQVDVGMEAE